ncbi:MAG: gliding motility protein GldN [Lachnoclostridium sp.]|nr:gliding motility protein GldN [Lachnoclostridium sp.]
MKLFIRLSFIFIALVTLCSPIDASAQDSSASGVRRNSPRDRKESTDKAGVTQRMQSFYEETPMSDSELQWMRVMYRQLDLTKDANGALYFPDENIEGQDNLFRIILKLVAQGQLPAYDYLDGREMFTDDYRVKTGDMLDRFHIYYTPAKGSTEKNPKFDIDPSDVPTTEVLSYYIIEKWEFDKRSNRMRTRIDAICPVLHRSGDFGGEAVKYPMFWVKYDDLRPYLSTQNIFTDDDNNLATCTYDDFFQLGLYEGDIYKTRNLKNKSLMQMHPDPEELKHAQDSIQQRLDTFEDKLWVPSLAELQARREAREEAEALAAAAAEGTDSIAADKPKVRSSRATRTKRGTSSSTTKTSKAAKVKKPKTSKPKTTSSSAARSVRNRKR